jgi:histidyl-tRNA synthetase
MDLVKGFRDYNGKEAEKRAVIFEIIRSIFEKYGFEPAETPIIEYEDFVKGNNSQDEAVRDIFKLKDRGKRKLALRYEFTFQLKRFAQNKKLPYKRYQIGYVFRDEPIRIGRTRQFIQCDADIIGSTIKNEAENLLIFKEVLEALKIDYTIYINNRKLLNEILDKEGLTKNKEEIIREIDKLDKLSEKKVLINLKKFNAEKLLNIFKKPEIYFERYDSYSEIKELKKYCKFFGVDVKFRSFLARGFSYYNQNVFEVWSKKLPVSICAGGSYIIGKNQSTGISFGFETLSLLTNLEIQLEKYLIVSLNQDRQAIKLAQKLRKQGKIVSMYYGKPSKAMEYANSYRFKKVIFVGAKEVKLRKFKVKIMKTGREVFLKV